METQTDNKKSLRDDLKLLEPFLVAIMDTFKTQFELDVKPGLPFRRGQQPELPKDVVAVFGVMGTRVSTSVSICLPMSTYLALMSKMLGEKIEKMEPGMEDGITELVNVVFGKVKKLLNVGGLIVKRLIPTVLFGKDLQLRYLAMGHSLSVPLETAAGPFHLEIATETN